MSEKFMHEKEITFSYQEFTHPDDLDPEDKVLLESARQALDTCYAPYSKFEVSCALQLQDNTILIGTNQENAALRLCICAEQNVLSTFASNHPGLEIKTMALTIRHSQQEIDKPVSPCGACREVIREFEDRQGKPIRIILQGMSGPVYLFNSITTLLPFPFQRELLK